MKFIVSLILLFSLLSLNVYVFAQSASADLGEETYRVYEAALRKMFEGNKLTFDHQGTIKQIIIRGETTTDFAYDDKEENWKQIKIRLPNLSDETVADYEARLKSPTDLKRDLNLGLKYSLFSKKDHETISVPAGTPTVLRTGGPNSTKNILNRAAMSGFQMLALIRQEIRRLSILCTGAARFAGPVSTFF